MSTRSRVLIVDQSPESREVLRAALELRGHEIMEAERSEQGLTLAQSARPDLVVWNLEERPANEPSNSEPAVTEQLLGRTAPATPVVFLGRTQPLASRQGLRSAFIAKPYHFQPLISTIERMLTTRRAA